MGDNTLEKLIKEIKKLRFVVNKLKINQTKEPLLHIQESKNYVMNYL